jgi:membrane-bound lytic murein transglycosylase B
MAMHRLKPPPQESALVPGLARAQGVWTGSSRHRAASSKRVFRAAPGPALNIATLIPLVLACAGSGVGRPAPGPAPASRRPVSAPVAGVANGVREFSGPAVVVAARPPIVLRIAHTDRPAPPPATAVNAPGAAGIPSMALSAYRNAEQKMTASDPSCGISWNLLAGIGRIESGHANGGATDARGNAVRPIYGPALDGTLPGNEVLAQHSADGQVSYARALGPMQFLPGTWARYASDGDGDGESDPQNIYDSTLAAARYLCSGGMNLRNESQVMTAILRYNNSMPYARNVLGWAAAYATGVLPVDLPSVTGPAPPLGDLHLEKSEGIGPGLPLNIHGLPPNDPLLQTPLIDLGASPVPNSAACTVICIESHSAPTQQAP